MNEQKRAIGLKYDQQQAPQVVAKGFGELAKQIIQLARDSGVLVHEDPSLSAFLTNLDLGQQIPAELYHVIAELIAFSYVLQGKFPDHWPAQPGGFGAKA